MVKKNTQAEINLPALPIKIKWSLPKVTFENIINYECFENFPNSGFTSLNFPIRKALGPLPKIAEKIPARIISHYKKLCAFK